jgi:hypothetical protein
MRIATFNVQGLRLRHHGEGLRLDGARDADEREDAFDAVDRRLTAAVIRDLRADVVALQEVFDAETLDHFHDRVLVPEGVAPYPHRVCLPGNDGRGLDVAVMSRKPFGAVASHAALRPADFGLAAPEGFGDQPVFRRDCLWWRSGASPCSCATSRRPGPTRRRRARSGGSRRRRCGGSSRRASRSGGGAVADRGRSQRPRPAAVARPRHRAARSALRPRSGLRMPEGERWTLYDPEPAGGSCRTRSSPRRALRTCGPMRCRTCCARGCRGRRGGGRGFPPVGEHRPHASDHAALVIDLPGL